jgi:hypothetical protein
MQRREVPPRRNPLPQQRFPNPITIFGTEFRRQSDRINEPASPAETAGEGRTNDLANMRQFAIVNLSLLLAPDYGLLDSRQLRNSQRAIAV